MSTRCFLRIAPAAIVALTTICAPSASTADGTATPTALQSIGVIELQRHLRFEEYPVGGLSSISWDAASGQLWAMCDDRSIRGPARVMRLAIDLTDGRLDPGDVTVAAQVILHDRHGRTFSPRTLDPEGFVLSADGFFVGSEGEAKVGLAPFVAEFDRDGRWRRELPLPARYLPDPAGSRGVRENLGFESLALTPDGRYLFAGTESALVQDGPEADFEVAATARLLRWDLSDPDAMPEEFVYRVEPVTVRVPTPATFRVNGLVELVALDDATLLSLERQFVAGVGVEARIFRVHLDGADSVASWEALPAAPTVGASKHLLLDLGDLGGYLDNVEGLAFGPPLPDGRRSLLVISDDNFTPSEQVTQVFAFAVEAAPLAVADVQGAGHRSPREGQWVSGLEGVVTGVVAEGRRPGFWLESTQPDSDARTSEGIFVETSERAPIAAGDGVRVSGRVVERERGANQLPVTTLELGALERLASSPPLPAPPRLWWELEIPQQIDDDGLSVFEPGDDAIDLWESLEGMRVELPAGVVTGATRAFGEFVVLPEGEPVTGQSAFGGALARPDGGGPLSRVFLDSRLAGPAPRAAVGDRLVAPLVGVVDYSYSNYRLLALQPPAIESSGIPCSRPARSEATPATFAVASLNVYNLSAVDAPERFARLAGQIVDGLGAPELLALQEVQDDSGARESATGDGVVAATGTLARLTDAIAAAGGPRYTAVQIDPELDREGGQPGGNIRVALLVDPTRVRYSPRGEPDALTAARFEGRGRRRALAVNPARVEPLSEAFAPRDDGSEGVRRSLVVEVDVPTGRRYWRRWQRVVVVVNHWSSKYEDDRAFGARQPPETSRTAERRLAQARVVRRFAQELLADDPRARLIVLGDFNDLAHSAPVVELARPPLENLVLRLPPSERYTFSFEGGAAAIDHIVVSPRLAEGASIEAVHLNTDCPDAERASDHDPLLARLPRR